MTPDDLDPVFRRLDPPPGGLADLRRRLAAERSAEASARRWRGPLMIAGLAAAALVVIAVLPRAPAPRAGWLEDATAAGDPALAALGLAPAPTAPVTLAPGAGLAAVQRVETATPGVVYYRVMPDPPR